MTDQNAESPRPQDETSSQETVVQKTLAAALAELAQARKDIHNLKLENTTLVGRLDRLELALKSQNERTRENFNQMTQMISRTRDHLRESIYQHRNHINDRIDSLRDQLYGR